MGNYVYWRSEPRLWTVGYIEPDGSKQPESDHDSTVEAAKRVHYLNGGTDDGLIAALKNDLNEALEIIHAVVNNGFDRTEQAKALLAKHSLKSKLI